MTKEALIAEHNPKPLLFTKEVLVGRVFWVISQLYPRHIFMLLTLIYSFASDLCNNKDIILVLGYNYNLNLRMSMICSYTAS